MSAAQIGIVGLDGQIELKALRLCGLPEAAQGTAPSLEHRLASAMAALPARIDQVIQPWAERTPDAPALAEADWTWTYGELARNAAFLRR